ncbi:MAG: polysaccharide biosynthesis/export family protein, partial [Panacagrimonas sp.]
MAKHLLFGVCAACIAATLILAGTRSAVAQSMPDARMLEAYSQLSEEEREELLRRFEEYQQGNTGSEDATRSGNGFETDPDRTGSRDTRRRDPSLSDPESARDPRRTRRSTARDDDLRTLDEDDEDIDQSERSRDRALDAKKKKKRKPEPRFQQLSRADQLAMAKACDERKKVRLKQERTKRDEELQERNISLGGSAPQDSLLTPEEKERRALEDRLPVRCTSDELEDYLDLVNPFSRFSDRPEPFGYDLFDQDEDSFLRPSADLPIPADYVLGPGDKVEVQLFGKENRRHVLTVTRDGVLQFPQLGPIEVTGMSFDDARELIQNSVSERMIGVQASVTLGPLRSIRVFVLGDVLRPGSYTVPAQSTVTNALFASGGIRETGSLRAVQVKRSGEVVSTLDLYDLLLRGDTGDDLALDAGDVVFVPAVGKTVSISGEVVRPATYEIRSPTATVADLVTLAGGLLPTAFAQNVALERIRGQTDRTIATLDLAAGGGRGTVLQSGDHLRVYSVFD